MTKLRVLSLFAGIGGFDLGLERTGGFETVAFCEIDPFCRRVLAKHWPKVPCYEDVRELTAERLRADGIVPDCIVGGFPCQDISCAGTGAGIEGERSGLWRDFARLIGELRPSFVVVENVSALLGRGLDIVLGDLASLGYDAEWHCIPAAALGASHRRDRIWILAHPQREQQRQDALLDGRHAVLGRETAPERGEGTGEASGCGGILADPAGERRREVGELRRHEQAQWAASRREAVADTAGIRHPRPGVLTQWCYPETNGAGEAAYALSGGQLGQWDAEPELGRVANGIPNRAHRLRALGNAVVPQIPELIGRAILASLEQERKAA
jgi:DNA (cytosine-5)-methyltransferase 1